STAVDSENTGQKGFPDNSASAAKQRAGWFECRIRSAIVGGVAMLSPSRTILAAAIVVLSPALVFTGVAYAFDLNGAWATDPDQCSKVFEKKGDSITLSDSSDLYGSGFVIDGKKVIGKTARCTINSTKEDGATINFLASCATEIMFQ